MSTVTIGSPEKQRIEFQISQADLIANNAQNFVMPEAGFLDEICVVVQSAVTTGGTINANFVPAVYNTEVGITPATQGDTLIPGSSGAGNAAGGAVTVANGAAKGTIYYARPTPGDPSTFLSARQLISLVLAGFATAGSVNGYIQWRNERLDNTKAH
ncbi:hypothetical protein M2322_002699 [Rhodoblastus acidophilus]|uniref:hypothetical protein n=1 Tax=Rhodoblastus acidophilus TaxID=1074 RepID=UPI0022259ADA|nr:hypothetical protein [Rhodoblastus acidophilus]MCW2317145.1 hypothetical protein [Rhodoblastus acidophilus]